MFRRVLLAAVLSAAFVSAASAATVSYTAHLSGRAEVPKTDSKGKGKLEATFDTQSKVFTYTLTFEDLSGPAAAAHIHGPANSRADCWRGGSAWGQKPDQPGFRFSHLDR